jgi:hypothetical protein
VIRSLSHLIRLDSEMCRKQPAPQWKRMYIVLGLCESRL